MKEQLVQKVREAGVVGAGGAGFPTHLKLAAQPERILINGAECEPLLRVDQQLLLAEADTLIRGLQMLRRAFPAAEIRLAVKAKHREVVARWRRLAGEGTEVSELADFYPAGDEHVLVKEVTGRGIPVGGIPLEAGAVVINVETLYNVARSMDNQPVTEKFVTVGGAVQCPVTVRVPVGTPLRDLLSLAGGPAVAEAVYLEGGPMMGSVVTDLDRPVTKTTKALLAIPADRRFVRNRRLSWEVVRRRSTGCEVCRICTDMCPRYLLGHPLEPHKVMRYFAFGGEHLVAVDLLGALLCVECGVCEEYACPAGMLPRRVMGEMKRWLLAKKVRYPGERGKLPQVREGRLDRRVPASRLVGRLGLAAYDQPAPWRAGEYRPALVRLPLKPSFGAPCAPLVRVGERVNKGTLIGVPPPGAPGSCLHASISGTVREITDDYVVVASEEVAGLASG